MSLLWIYVRPNRGMDKIHIGWEMEMGPGLHRVLTTGVFPSISKKMF